MNFKNNYFEKEKTNFYLSFKKLFIIFLFCEFIIFIVYNKVSEQNNIDYDLIIPISNIDFQLFLNHIKFYKKYLNFTKIILIGPSFINEKIKNYKFVSFINEAMILDKKEINDFLLNNRAITTRRDGWFEQQFIKMAYSKFCKKKFYLVWDADTMPIKKFKLFENNLPFFDMKIEHHIPYFNTIERLLPGLKVINRSYISEHMMIKTEYMKKLIKHIEKNKRLKGKLFWEKILMAIDLKYINTSGFSEYETYGCFVDTKYPNNYNHRNWYSKRDARFYYDNSDNLNDNDINWLSKDYHALSFEKWTKFESKNLIIVKNQKLHKLYNPIIFFKNYNYFLSNITKSENISIK